MIKKIFPWSVAVALTVTSCTYDPYYSPFSGSASYGYGHGYGSSNFSTSLFVSTGDARWGYDPHTYCYYDYRTRRYYDPYLYGYYPVGYRPRAVYGVPHPYGWRPGRDYCPPPKTVRNVTVVNYHHRESAYRNSGHSWASQVRQAPIQENYRQGREARYDQNRRSSPAPEPSSMFSPSQGWLNTRNRENPRRDNQAMRQRETQIRPSAPAFQPEQNSAPAQLEQRRDQLEGLRMNDNRIQDIDRPARNVEPAPRMERPEIPPNRDQAPERPPSDNSGSLRGLGEG